MREGDINTGYKLVRKVTGDKGGEEKKKKNISLYINPYKRNNHSSVFTNYYDQ